MHFFYQGLHNASYRVSFHFLLDKYELTKSAESTQLHFTDKSTDIE